MKFATSIDSSHNKGFLWSTPCCLTAFYPQQNFFQNKPVNPLKPFQCFMNQFLQPFLSFQPRHSVFTRNRFLLRKPLCSFIRKKRLLPVNGLSWDCSESIMLSGMTPVLILVLCSFHRICSYLLHWSLEPLKIIHEAWNKLLPNLC